MKNSIATVIAATIGAALSLAALADPMSRTQYQTERKTIESDYRTAKLGCEPMPAAVKEVCLADVKGRQDVALAELEVAFAPGHQARYDLRIVKARAAYSVASRKCEDKSGLARDACLKEVEAASAASRIDAAAQLKAEAHAARAAPSDAAAATRDPEVARRDSDYSNARERCDVYTGVTKDLCASEAKRRFGKT